MDEYCKKEGELAAIKTDLEDLKKIIKGNGQKGLRAQVIELNTVIPPLTASVKELSDKVQILLDKRLASDTVRNYKMTAEQRLAAIIAGIIGGSTTVVMVIDLWIRSR